MQKLTQALIKFLNSFQDLSLLGIRLILAYGFYDPAIKKLGNFDSVVSWFDQGLHLPFPVLNAVLATATEALGVVLLTLGLGSRFIAIPMIGVMVVAISTVHWTNGFAASNNGFEIPLYYLLMLSVIITLGPGKYSMDETFLKKYFGTPGKK